MRNPFKTHPHLSVLVVLALAILAGFVILSSDPYRQLYVRTDRKLQAFEKIRPAGQSQEEWNRSVKVLQTMYVNVVPVPGDESATKSALRALDTFSNDLDSLTRNVAPNTPELIFKSLCRMSDRAKRYGERHVRAEDGKLAIQ